MGIVKQTIIAIARGSGDGLRAYCTQACTFVEFGIAKQFVASKQPWGEMLSGDCGCGRQGFEVNRTPASFISNGVAMFSLAVKGEQADGHPSRFNII